MSALLSLRLPEPPSSNRYWRVFRGRAVKSGDARAYSTLVLADYRRQTTAIQRQQLPLDGPVGISLAWYRSCKSGDLDNRAKVLLDAVKGLLYHDDKQVECLTMTRHESPRKGYILVELWTALPPIGAGGALLLRAGG